MVKGIIILLFSLFIGILITELFYPPTLGSGNMVKKWEVWDYPNFIVNFSSLDNNINMTYNGDENALEINTKSGDLLLNPALGIRMPIGKYISIGDLAGIDKLYLTTVGGNHALISVNKDLRITTNRNLELKASNTIFPAVNSITYLLASNAARYNELRTCYGTGTGATKYVSVWHDGTAGNVRSSSGGLILSSNSTIIQVKYNLTIGDTGYPGCIQLRDSNDGGWTKCQTLAGVLNCTVGTC